MTHMKRFLPFPLLLIALCLMLHSCGPGGNTFRIKGTFRDMQAGEIYIYNLSSSQARFDTLTVQEGKFQYKGQADAVTPYLLVFPKGVEQVVFVTPGQEVRYEASANDLKNYVVTGTDENELMNQFRQEAYTLNPTTIATTARTYILQHPQSLVAIYLLDTYFVQNENAANEELAQLLRTVKAPHPHNHYLLDIESKLNGLQRRQVGKTLPDVTLMRPDRTTVPLGSTSSTHHLLVFWSIWSNTGSEVLWNLRRYMEKHPHTAARLRIVAISLDIERPRWEDAIRPDTLTPIHHYCDGRSFESKAIKTLGIHTVPFYILTDSTRRVLDSGDDPNKIEEMIGKYIRQD